MERKLILEDGTVLTGQDFGSTEEKVLEIVFNTSMVGYQEILSDPSYTDQAVVMTYPLIGNYGIAEEDYETRIPTIGALIVREYNDQPSNFRSSRSLRSVMEQYGICGIQGVDTRMLTRHIRDHGSGKVLLTDCKTPAEEGLQRLWETQLPHNAVSRVSRIDVEEIPGKGPHIVLIDCGAKENIVRSLVKRGVRVTIVPWKMSSDWILARRPDGVLISNGPGDPTDVPETIQTVKELIGQVPLFGICLGHQILSLAYGARTYKLKFGHRGGNHPVKDLRTGKIVITSQNHSYAVDRESLLATPLQITHVNLLDQTVEGVSCEKDRAFSVQYHPESAPGPEDSGYLFEQFLERL